MEGRGGGYRENYLLILTSIPLLPSFVVRQCKSARTPDWKIDSKSRKTQNTLDLLCVGGWFFYCFFTLFYLIEAQLRTNEHFWACGIIKIKFYKTVNKYWKIFVGTKREIEWFYFLNKIFLKSKSYFWVEAAICFIFSLLVSWFLINKWNEKAVIKKENKTN